MRHAHYSPAMQATTMHAGEKTMANESRQENFVRNSLAETVANPGANSLAHSPLNALAKIPVKSAAAQTTTPATGAEVLTAAAGLLILLGLMAQLGELGVGPFTRDTYWIIPFLAEGLWNILMALLSSTALADASPLWPLTFVLAGCAAIFLLNAQGPVAVAQESSKRSDRGR
jgi:hypothetical protein